VSIHEKCSGCDHGLQNANTEIRALLLYRATGSYTRLGTSQRGIFNGMMPEELNSTLTAASIS
jgi:hypothetical protein